MAELTKSQKIRISLTVVWAVVTALLSGLFSEGNFGPFLGIFVFLNLPTLLYWLGFWIWGDGYLLRLISWPFKKIFADKKEGQEASIGRKIFAVISAILVFMFVGTLIRVTEEAPKFIFPNLSERALSNMEALGALSIFILAYLAARKIYLSVSRPKINKIQNLENNTKKTLSKKQKVTSHITTTVCIILAFVIIFISANEQQISAAFLLGEVIGASVLFGAIAMLIIPKHWIKAPALSIVFMIASVLIGYPEYKEAKDARYAAISMIETIENEYIDAATAENIDEVQIGTVEVPSSNKMAPFINWVNQSRERGAAILLDYSNSFPPDIENTLTPENLSNIVFIRKSKADILQILNTIPSYKGRIKNHFETIEQELEKLDVNEELKTGALLGFRENMNSNIDSYYEYFEIQEAMLNEFLSLLSFMEDAFDTYEYDENGQIFFLYEHDIDKFNKLMASITNYVLLEQEWAQKVQRKELSTVKKLKEKYNE